MDYPGPLESVTGLLVLGLGPIGLGAAFSYPWVGAVIVRNGPVSLRDQVKRFGWLSIPLLLAHPIGLYLSSLYPTRASTDAALIGMAATLGVTLAAGLAAIVVLKGHRFDAIAVAGGNLVVALLCAFFQLAVFALTRGA